MLKIILYGYINRIYSSRKIAKQLGENIYFMWLSGNQNPDFRTINRFRTKRMKDVIYETFFGIVDLLCQEGLVKLEDYYFDGTKIEGATPIGILLFGGKQQKSTIPSWMRNTNRLSYRLKK